MCGLLYKQVHCLNYTLLIRYTSIVYVWVVRCAVTITAHCNVDFLDTDMSHTWYLLFPWGYKISTEQQKNRAHARTHARTHTRTHARTHAHTHTHVHTHKKGRNEKKYACVHMHTRTPHAACTTPYASPQNVRSIIISSIQDNI